MTALAKIITALNEVEDTGEIKVSLTRQDLITLRDKLMAPPITLTLARLQQVNVERSKRWHGPGQEWTPLEWAGALCGEAGEAANAAKKLKRVETQMSNHDGRLFGQEKPLDMLARDYRKQVGRECADTILYAVLLAAEVGEDIEDAVREVFNKKSREYGFPERV